MSHQKENKFEKILRLQQEIDTATNKRRDEELLESLSPTETKQISMEDTRIINNTYVEDGGETKQIPEMSYKIVELIRQAPNLMLAESLFRAYIRDFIGESSDSILKALEGEIEQGMISAGLNPAQVVIIQGRIKIAKEIIIKTLN